MAALVVLRTNQQVLRHRTGHGDNRLVLAEMQQEVLHLGLEIEAVPEHQIRLRHGGDVGAGLAIGMRVHARPHQGPHLDQIATDLRDGIGDHAGRDDHVEPLLSGGPAGGQRHGERRRGCNKRSLG